MSDEAQSVDELKSLKRIEDLLTVLARAALADRIDEIMNDKSHRVVLELTGKMTVRQLAKKTGLSPMTISRLWQKWEEIGLLAKDGKQYRRVL
jgi:predicted transcriptional regulator